MNTTNGDPVRFWGRTRGFHWATTEVGLAIKAYMSPEISLERRGLIERVVTNYPGTAYRLTEHGALRAKRIDGACLRRRRLSYGN